MSAARSPEARYRAVLDKRLEGENLVVVALAKRQGVNLRTLYWWPRFCQGPGKLTTLGSPKLTAP